MNIFDILAAGQEPKAEELSNEILKHLIEELKEIFTVTEIKYEVWNHVPNLGKRMTATLKDLPDGWDITEIMDRYLKDYQLELSTTIWDPLYEEEEIWLSTMWTTKGHKERTDWKEEPKKIKLPLSMKYCSIIGADCACHDEKGCEYPEKCGLLKEVAENNNLEREEKMAAVQEKPIRHPCERPCDVEWCSKECFIRRGNIWNTQDGGWVRNSQGEILRTQNRECDYDADQKEAEAKTEEQEPQPLDIRGLCDDGYCPNCDHAFDQYLHPDEIDCEVCPECGTPLDWTSWHKMNDPELKDKYPDLDTRYINPDTKEIEDHPFEWNYTDTDPPKIEDIYFGCIISKDNVGEDMYTYTTIRFMDGVYWIFNHSNKEWLTLAKGDTVIAWREYTSSELNTIRDYDSMVIHEIEEEDGERDQEDM